MWSVRGSVTLCIAAINDTSYSKMSEQVNIKSSPIIIFNY